MNGPQPTVSEKDGGVVFPIRLHPRAGRDRLAGLAAGRWKIEVSAPPVRNQANRALVKLLHRELKVPQDAIAILQGATGRDKLIHIRGLSAERLLKIFPQELL